MELRRIVLVLCFVMLGAMTLIDADGRAENRIGFRWGADDRFSHGFGKRFRDVKTMQPKKNTELDSDEESLFKSHKR